MTADQIREVLSRPTCTVDQWRAVVGLSRNSAYDAVKRNEVPSIRIGHRILIPTAPVRQMLGIEL